jgi:FecR protein
MNKYFRKSVSGEFGATCLFFSFLLLQPAGAALNSARVTQVIHDVKLVPSSATPRPAAINDDVREGTAVRTGQDSRTELTFTDKTLTRLGANSIFSFNVGAGTFDLGQGSILMQVPPNGSSVKVKTAAVTAAITGGTAIFGTGPPTKFMVLEGTGTFYPTGHPDEAMTLHGGEMVTFTPDGHMIGPTPFNVKTVLGTSELILPFPDLANLPLIWDVIREQDAGFASESSTPPPKDSTDEVDQKSAASPPPSTSPTPSGTPSKFGPPSTITSPDPYVINSGTQIQTDPSITTSGQTNFGKVWRGPETDGPFSAFIFGSTSSFDTASGFDIQLNGDMGGAGFKFTSLQLTGDPTVSTTNGEINLGLIAVNGITSGSPGGTLTFAGIRGLLLATENGSINLGPEISFSGLHDMTLYARGAGSNLIIGSAISTSSEIRLFSQGNIQISGALTTNDFTAFSGGDFLQNGGVITATSLDIHSLSNITLDASKIPDGGGGPITLNAANTLTINNMTGGLFGRDSLTGQAMTINLQGTSTPTTFDFSQSSSVALTAGTGGINASGIDFFGHNLSLISGGNIDIYSARTPLDLSENHILDGTINATDNITSVGDIDTGTIHAGGSMTVGGQLLAGDISADGNVSGAQGVIAVGGSIVAGGNITSQNGTIELQQNPPGTFGNITAGGNIFAGGGIFTPGDPVVVMAGGSITAPGVITGTLQAGTDITIDNTPGSFGFGIIANHIIAGGTLFMINSPTISPNNGGFGGNDGETFDDFTMTVGSIVSTGPTFPILSSNGGDANPDFADSNPGNGGNISLTTTTGGLTIGNAQDLDSISTNGGAYNASGPFGGGNGGKIDIMSAGDVVINAPNSGGPAISASTGVVADDTTTFAGNGGTVNITSTGGAITVNGTVQVSNDDQRIPDNNGAGRESASGGTIDLQSNLTTGTGITVGANGALLSYLSLNAVNADGTPGSITLSTMGADIVVSGTVRADFGTVTLDQNDPAGATPTITLDGGTVQAATFNINGSGDLTIGPNNATAINIFGGTWNVAHDITLNAANTTFAYSFTLNATAGNAINFTGGNSDSPATLAFPLSGDTTFTAGAGGINAPFVAITNSGANLNLISAGSITAYSIIYPNSASGTIAANGGALTLTGDLTSGNVSALTTIDIGGNVIVSTMNAGTTIQVGGRLAAFDTVSAGGDITADTVAVPNITTPGVLTAGSGGIKPFVFSTDPSFPAQGAKAPHVFTVDSIVSPNGIDFSGNQFDGIDGYSSGGILTINANSLSFDSSTGIGPVNFNGADENGFSNGTTPTMPGDGGNLTVNTTGTIVVNSDIEATSGYFQPVPSATPAGFGGTVDLNSSGDTVTVNNRIEVSSAEPASTIAPFRQSARGGNINLTSGKTSGVAINVGSSAQLLSLLSAAAPGPGGKITILASASNNSGNSSSINIDNSNGLIAADGSGGTVDIEHNGDSGTININNANIRADVVKVGALGDNGTLNIGGGTINADTMLKLYATGSNGSVNFIANVTLSGAATKIIVGNTVAIFNSVVVTISGPAATVYTNHPNYTVGSGGNGSTTGMFSGTGATTVNPIGTPPPF